MPVEIDIIPHSTPPWSKEDHIKAIRSAMERLWVDLNALTYHTYGRLEYTPTGMWEVSIDTEHGTVSYEDDTINAAVTVLEKIVKVREEVFEMIALGQRPGDDALALAGIEMAGNRVTYDYHQRDKFNED